MNIGVEVSGWSRPQQGSDRYLRELFQALLQQSAHRWVFFTDSEQSAFPLPAGAEVRQILRRRRSWSNWPALSAALSRAPVDVLVFPTVESVLPCWGRARQLAIAHGCQPRRRWLWRLKLEWIRRRGQLVTVSSYAQRCLGQLSGCSPEKIPIVPAGVSPLFRPLENPILPPRLPSGRRFLTHVGGFDSSRNLPGLVQAFADLASQLPDIDLVLVGERRDPAHYRELRALEGLVEQLGLASRVHFAGYLPDEQLVDLLNLSLALVVPSWSESKGLAALEAAACGCPVIATERSPIPGLLGSAGLYFDPSRPQELRLALEQLGNLSRQTVPVPGWEQSARQLEAVLESL